MQRHGIVLIYCGRRATAAPQRESFEENGALLITERIRIVLVETSHPGNIGATARAMKTMGFKRLVLVKPRRFPDPEAEWMAASAGDVLTQARVVDSLDEAIADCHMVIGTSARSRRIPWPCEPPRVCAERAAAASVQGEVALVFGREDSGLSNDELQRCNLHLHIPSHPDYTSLNLAMAVQLVAYELRLQALAIDSPEPPHWDAPPATQADLERLYEHLEETLIAIGFLDPAAPRHLMARLRRLYNRVGLDAMELNILRGILTETQARIAPARDEPRL
jgi:tRNA (cytidine32/uridine32-2'-O)-methyltransferase